MNPQLSQIARLLRAREEAFVTVRECEDRVRQRLGGAAFPFPPPPALPAARRRSSRPPAEAPRGAAEALRRLTAGEDAYRITGLCRGAPCVAFSEDPEVVRALTTAPAAVLAVQRLDVVCLDDAGSVTSARCLWQAESRPAGAESAGPV
jgi:hypothetical protein